MTLHTKFNLGKYTTFFAILPSTFIFFLVFSVIQSSAIPRDYITLNNKTQEVVWTCKKVFQFLYDDNFNTTFDFQMVLYSYTAIKSP